MKIKIKSQYDKEPKKNIISPKLINKKINDIDNTLNNLNINKEKLNDLE
jgi:hypothetical protein